MAKKKFDIDNHDDVTTNDIFENIGIPSSQLEDAENIRGLTDNEIKDPNDIKVTIDDEKTPIVVLFGPPSCGKTMVLVRLTRYLRKLGLSVEPERTFRPSADVDYKKICDNFNEVVTNEYAAESTKLINFMLLKVWKKGGPICQILEAPGEHYFNPSKGASNEEFPRYINNIFNKNNRKIFLIIVEPQWDGDSLNYVERIKQLKVKMRGNDKVIILYNKIDQTKFVTSRGKTNIQQAIKSVSDRYNGIFESFKNETPLVRFLTPYNCKFVPFSTGDYNETTNKNFAYEASPDEYPSNLWKVIMKCIKG